MASPREAAAAVLEALRALGFDAREADAQDSVADHTPDIVATPQHGKPIAIKVKYTSLASVDGLHRRLQDADQWLRSADSHPSVGILVADRVTGAAREFLQQAGWGWLDLRGHMRLCAPGIFVHADLPKPVTEHLQSADPFTGRGGFEVAVDLLLRPAESAGVRAIAHRIDRAPSTVSEVLNRLRKSQLVDAENRPMIPELFWELAAVWRPESADIATLPDGRDAGVMETLRVGFDSPPGVGWALTDSRAAAVYDAPISLRADHPEDFYVPNTETFHRALRLLGKASDHATRAATITVAPVREVCANRVTELWRRAGEWPLAQPLFVALDLARDPVRGRAILDAWTPPSPWQRVW